MISIIMIISQSFWKVFIRTISKGSNICPIYWFIILFRSTYTFTFTNIKIPSRSLLSTIKKKKKKIKLTACVISCVKKDERCFNKELLSECLFKMSERLCLYAFFPSISLARSSHSDTGSIRFKLAIIRSFFFSLSFPFCFPRIWI